VSLAQPQTPLPLRRLLNPFRAVADLWHHQDLIAHLVRRELGQRYKGSYLGVLWSFINPLLMLSVYTFVFSVVFRASWRPDVESPPAEFALTLFAGLTAFGLLSEVMIKAPGLVLAVPSYVKKVVFPLEVLPVVAVGAALITSLLSAGLIVLGALVLSGSVSPTLFLLPVAYTPLVLLCLGLAWFLASLGVYVRDIAQGIGVVTQVLFFLSPVFYPQSAVPQPWRDALNLNPMTHVVTSFRQILLWGQWPEGSAWLHWTGVSLLVAVLGYTWFMKTKRGFADVL
jgi:lipopolysaccharide transport system permease protein